MRGPSLFLSLFLHCITAALAVPRQSLSTLVPAGMHATVKTHMILASESWSRKGLSASMRHISNNIATATNADAADTHSVLSYVLGLLRRRW